MPVLPLYILGLCMLAYNGLFRLYLDRRLGFPRRASGWDYRGLLQYYWRGLEREGFAEAASFDRFFKLQLGLDWLAMVLLVHFSGGVTSPLLFFFVFHIITASLLLSQRDCYLSATLATLLVGGLALLEYTGLVAHVQVFGASLHQEGLYVAGVLLFFTTSLYLSVYLATTLTRQLRQRDEELLSLQDQLSSAYVHLQTMYDVTTTATSTLLLEEVLNLIARKAAGAMQVRACVIMLAGDDGAQMDMIASYGLSQRYLDAGPVDARQIDHISRTLRSGQPTIVRDTTRIDQLMYPSGTRAAGIGSILSVPLLIRGKAEGVISVYSDEPDHFADGDARFLSTVVSAAATAVENARVYKALQMADRARSDFVRMVTHEFRSPLSAVQSMLNLLQTGIVGPLTDKQRDLIDRSQQRLSLLLATVGDLLELAAGSMEVLEGEKKRIDLGEILARVAELMEPRARDKAVGFSVEIAEEPLVVLGFEDGLERALMNLVSNAVKYTPEDGRVTVRAWAEQEEIRLEVSDTGIGIPEDALPRIFSEFYRAKNAKAMEVDGTGLGLVIAKEAVERHGGQITVHSVVGEGSTFSVSLSRGPG
jgi:signal transduction histidine kinase